jgi:hypothetical protein
MSITSDKRNAARHRLHDGIQWIDDGLSALHSDEFLFDTAVYCLRAASHALQLRRPCPMCSGRGTPGCPRCDGKGWSA